MVQPLILFDESREETAWEEYRRLVIAMTEDKSLCADREHMRALARAERRWKHIYLARAA